MIDNNTSKLENSSKIAAVVVTYNRLELLKKVINGLRSQTYKLDTIFVVNNSSNDGTAEWLAQQSDIEIITQPNLGSSGGQYIGSFTAYNAGYEWIWQMDDDVVADKYCLENLMKYSKPDLVCTPKRITSEGQIFYNEPKVLNLTNPFKSIWKGSSIRTKGLISEKDFDKEVIFAEGITFEGPLFHRSVFSKIGFVEKDFFIFADDTEFCVRLKKSGIKTAIIKSAVFYRQLPFPINTFDWKTYYVIRNLIAIDKLHGSLSVRLIRPFEYFLSWLFRCKNRDNMKTVLKAFYDGYFYKSKQ